MRAYFLFIDTETSGLPNDWDLPFEEVENWPSALQIAWSIYQSDGHKVKEENHYISRDTLYTKGEGVHHITQDLINEKGEYIEVVLQLLKGDIEKYDPLVIGHYVEFDYKVLGAEYYKNGIDFPLQGQPIYCTMLGSAHLASQISKKKLRLIELYSLLFHTNQLHPHNALYDVKATAECFFYMLKTGMIQIGKIEEQSPLRPSRKYLRITRKIGWTIVFLLIILLMTLCTIHP